MKLNRKATNGLIAGFLAIIVMTAGFFAYQQKASADTITPGFATAHVALRIAIPTARSINFRVVFNSTNGSKRYYFKERVFNFETPGLNSVEWYIRKIPEGTFSVEVTADSTTLSPSPTDVSLAIDKVTDTAKFELNLGMPEVPEPEISSEATDTADVTDTTTVDTSGDLYGPEDTATPDPEPYTSTSVVVPPVPQLPTN